MSMQFLDLHVLSVWRAYHFSFLVIIYFLNEYMVFKIVSLASLIGSAGIFLLIKSLKLRVSSVLLRYNLIGCRMSRKKWKIQGRVVKTIRYLSWKTCRYLWHLWRIVHRKKCFFILRAPWTDSFYIIKLNGKIYTYLKSETSLWYHY